MTYGYCRISRKTQNIERQERNILAVYPSAYIIKETYTGTKLDGRKDLDRLLKIIKPNDKVVFDSASRMSRNSEEGCQLYENLFNQNIELEFLKEPQINTAVYKQALENQIQIAVSTGNDATDAFIASIINALNKYSIELAKQQIRIIFDQAEKEVTDLHQRTAEGILTAKLNGKRIGTPKGAKLTTQKSIKAKEVILRHSKDFNGTLKDSEVMILTGLARNTYYKYKKELLADLDKKSRG